MRARAKACLAWSADIKCGSLGARKLPIWGCRFRKLRPAWNVLCFSTANTLPRSGFAMFRAPDGRSFVEHLRPRHHVNRVLLVSGDRESEVRYLADLMGIHEIHSAKSPEEKVVDCPAGNRGGENPVCRRWHQRRAGHAGSDGGSRFRDEQ